MDRCIILMATYNGGNYLSEQIDSIIAQTHQNWLLCISDDGSDDTTLDIIKQYMNKDKRISLYHNAEKHGAYCNFYSLIKKVKDDSIIGDFYLFADQDDIWNIDKLEVMIQYFKDVNYPMLCYADMIIMGRNNDGWLMSRALKNKYKNPASVMLSNQIHGCNCIMNSYLFTAVPIPTFDYDDLKILSHDNYYVKWAAVLGKVKFINIATMYYRRYEGNITSQQQYGYGIKRILGRLKNFGILAQLHAKVYNQTLMFLHITEGFIIDNNQKELLYDTKRLIENGGAFALIYFWKYKVNCGNLIKTFSRLLILLLGDYKKYLITDYDV